MQTTITRLGGALIAALFATFLAATAFAAAPTTLLVEGALYNLAGGPVADGAYTLTFAIWDAEKAGTKSWSEGPVTVKASAGRFSWALGSKSKLDVAKLAALSGQWLGIRIGNDPEQPRKPFHATAFALTAANLSCGGCVQAKALGVAYAGSTTKGGAATKALDVQCTGCVSVSEMKFDGTVDLGGNGLSAGKVTVSGDIQAQGVVAASKFVGDGSQLSGIKTPSGQCPLGKVMTGIDGNGKPQCQTFDVGGVPKGLSNEFTDELHGSKGKDIPDFNSNGLLDTIDVPDVGTTKTFEVVIEISKAPFVDVKPKDGIADYDPTDLTVLLFPPTTKALPSPRSNIVNNFLSKPAINGSLFPHYVLSQGAGKGTLTLFKTYPTKDKPLSGDLTAWVGKNPKGKWRLLILDNGDRVATDGKDLTNDGKLVDWHIKLTTNNDKQLLVSGSQFVGGTLWGKYQGHGNADVGAPLKVGGGIQVGNTSTKCEAKTEGTIRYNKTAKGIEFCNGTAWSASNAFGGGATYRWAVWSTYSQAHGWYADNRPELFGGVTPQRWGDQNYCAYQMSSSSDYLRTLYTRRGPRIGTLKHVNIYAESYRMYSSTNSRHASALFRIRNNTSKAITWSAKWYGTGYGGWGERRSVALNGKNIVCSSGDYGANAETTTNLSIPANRGSTAIFIASSTRPSGDLRACFMAFYNNSLVLPAGLEFVDDLDTKPNGWDK